MFYQNLLLPVRAAERVNLLSPPTRSYRSAGRDKVGPYRPLGN